MVVDLKTESDRKKAKKTAWAAAAAVLDPEVPAVTVAELGMLRDVSIDDEGRAVAKVSPTYSGCPAVLAIELAIETALNKAGFEAVIERVISPPWTTDWITEEGREKLRAYGIAPPVKSSTSPRALFGEVSVDCPSCSSSNTVKISEFGSTACKAQYQCRDCAEPFEYFKCI
jgi:ring-1,2-phenylacetyl-CoA epoxidase subunit PaaD